MSNPSSLNLFEYPDTFVSSIRDATYATPANMDSSSVGFMMDVKTFLRQTRWLDITFPDAAWNIVWRFRNGFNLDIHVSKICIIITEVLMLNCVSFQSYALL